MVQYNRKLFRYAVDIFIDILQKIANRRINYKCNDADVKSYAVFQQRYGNNIGEEFVRKFVEFSFNDWFPKDREYDKDRNMRLSWILSKRICDKWDSNSISRNVYFTRKNLKKEFNLTAFVNSKKQEQFVEMVNALIDSEEKFKHEFLNTKRGLPWCVANTKLFFHKSTACAICESKDECKELLRTEYPKIYIAREYDR